MESDKIEILLELYFEGETSLEEEKTLREYFMQEKIAPDLEPYKHLFMAFAEARKDEVKKPLKLQKSRSQFPLKTAVAVMIAVMIGAGAFFLSKPSLTSEEIEALQAFEQSRETMMLLSAKFNYGTEQLQYLDEFTEVKEKIFEDKE